MLRQPITSYQFRVLFGGDFNVLTENLVSIDVDFIGRSIEVVIRDTIDNATAQALIDYRQAPSMLVWDIMDRGNNTVLRSYTFTALTAEAHTLRQEYSVSEAVSQVVVFSYEDCDTDYA